MEPSRDVLLRCLETLRNRPHLLKALNTELAADGKPDVKASDLDIFPDKLLSWQSTDLSQVMDDAATESPSEWALVAVEVDAGTRRTRIALANTTNDDGHLSVEVDVADGFPRVSVIDEAENVVLLDEMIT